MRTLSGLVLSCFFLINSAHSQKNNCRPLDAKSFKQLVEMKLFTPIGISFYEKRIARLGDDAGIMLAQSFTEDELLQNDRLDRVIAILRVAFSYPEGITEKENRKPRVTVLLLKELENRAKDDEVKKRLVELEKKLQKDE